MLGALAAALAVGLVVWATRVPVVPAVSLRAASLVRTLQFSGKVATLSRVDVGSTLTGRVVEVTVAEGAALAQRWRRGATSLDLPLRDVWVAQALAADLSPRLPYKVESGQEGNSQLVAALNAQSISTVLIRGVVMVVVVLGITSVLVVSVVQKRREIGILQAMGATRGQVLRVFLLQGTIVGAMGSVLSVLLAVVLIWAFTTLVLGADGLPLFAITLSPRLALQVGGIATLCGVSAAVVPARRAAALDPAQAIRM